MSDPWSTGGEAGVEYHDTIAMLQEEVARLEEELRLRDEERTQPEAPAVLPAPIGESADPRLAALTNELSIREETIELLVEQVRLLEEAAAADRDEWEQLHRWVQEVERRVEQNDHRGEGLSQEVEARRREAESLHRTLAEERRAWDVRRKAAEEEIAGLRERLAEAAGPRGPEAGIEALEAENLRLRQRCRELEEAAPDASEHDALDRRFLEVREELEGARREVCRLADDLGRERIEHEAALASFRSQMARDRIERRADAEEGPDERIRALRLHLNEIHQREQQERSERRLSARLSRLWHRSGPNG